MATIAELTEPFISDLRQRARPNTRRSYRNDLAVASRYLPQPLDQLTAAAVDGFLATPDCKPATSARRAAALSRFFVWAVRHGHADHNPLDGREGVSLPRRLPRPIPAADRKRVDAAIAELGAPFRLAFTMLRETGMRASEVLALNVGDVLLDAGREGLRVREPKGNTERLVILGADATPRTLRLLRQALRESDRRPHEPLFRSNRGTRLSYTSLYQQWAGLCVRAKLTDSGDDGALRTRYTIHQLRHTRGTELVEQGLDLVIVQRALGHRDIRSTQGYADLSDEQLRASLAEAAQRTGRD